MDYSRCSHKYSNIHSDMHFNMYFNMFLICIETFNTYLCTIYLNIWICIWARKHFIKTAQSFHQIFLFSILKFYDVPRTIEIFNFLLFHFFRFIAPEVLLESVYTRACDIYSVGVVLFILLSGTMPFSKSNKGKILVRRWGERDWEK